MDEAVLPLLLTSLLGGLLALDTAPLGTFLLSRPLPACLLLATALGVPQAGLAGLYFELLGARPRPDRGYPPPTPLFPALLTVMAIALRQGPSLPYLVVLSLPSALPAWGVDVLWRRSNDFLADAGGSFVRAGRPGGAYGMRAIALFRLFALQASALAVCGIAYLGARPLWERLPGMGERPGSWELALLLLPLLAGAGALLVPAVPPRAAAGGRPDPVPASGEEIPPFPFRARLRLLIASLGVAAALGFRRRQTLGTFLALLGGTKGVPSYRAADTHPVAGCLLLGAEARELKDGETGRRGDGETGGGGGGERGGRGEVEGRLREEGESVLDRLVRPLCSLAGVGAVLLPALLGHRDTPPWWGAAAVAGCWNAVTIPLRWRLLGAGWRLGPRVAGWAGPLLPGARVLGWALPLLALLLLVAAGIHWGVLLPASAVAVAAALVTLCRLW